MLFVVERYQNADDRYQELEKSTQEGDQFPQFLKAPVGINGQGRSLEEEGRVPVVRRSPQLDGLPKVALLLNYH